MNIPFEFLLITSSVGAVQSGFCSVYLLSGSKQKEVTTRLLGLLLLVLAVRMAKSCAWYFSQDNLPAILENIGYAAHLAIAPLLFLYIKSSVEINFKFRKSYLLHFLPTFLSILFSPILDDWFWLGEFGGYLNSLFLFGFYFPFIYYLLLKKFNFSRAEKFWFYTLTIAINLVWATYAANFLLGWVSYITAPTVFSLVIYPISFFALKQNQIFAKTAKYQNSGLPKERIELFGGKIENLLKIEKIHLDSNLTLPKLAKMIGVSTQIASEIINRYFKMNFADLINSQRIEEAKERLKVRKNANKKIAAIAFECGFGTLSGFNTIFKKHTNLTPTEFKQKFSK